jgi:hypothetical protein
LIALLLFTLELEVIILIYVVVSLLNSKWKEYGYITTYCIPIFGCFMIKLIIKKAHAPMRLENMLGQ